MRPVDVKRGYLKHAEGSAFITVGDTKVICSASVENRTPQFLRDTGYGWVTAEYAMLPRSSDSRNVRESSRGRVRGRTHEIQRLIGRSLRAITDLSILGERTIWIDCDVIQADGGTRTASITGAFFALYDAALFLLEKELIPEMLLGDYLGAVSVGLVGDQPLLDLNYEEDSSAQVDMNVVMTGRGLLVEVQGTGEERPFSQEELEGLLELAGSGIGTLVEMERKIVGDIPAREIYQAGHFVEE
jgi:ribonuclease PH